MERTLQEHAPHPSPSSTSCQGAFFPFQCASTAAAVPSSPVSVIQWNGASPEAEVRPGLCSAFSNPESPIMLLSWLMWGTATFEMWETGLQRGCKACSRRPRGLLTLGGVFISKIPVPKSHSNSSSPLTHICLMHACERYPVFVWSLWIGVHSLFC